MTQGTVDLVGQSSLGISPYPRSQLTLYAFKSMVNHRPHSNLGLESYPARFSGESSVDRFGNAGTVSGASFGPAGFFAGAGPPGVKLAGRA